MRGIPLSKIEGSTVLHALRALGDKLALEDASNAPVILRVTKTPPVPITYIINTISMGITYLLREGKEVFDWSSIIQMSGTDLMELLFSITYSITRNLNILEESSMIQDFKPFNNLQKN